MKRLGIQTGMYWLLTLIICSFLATSWSCASKKGPETQADKTSETKKSASKSTQSSTAQSATNSTLSASKAVVATSVEELTPQGEASTFQPGVERLYCFTKIDGAQDQTFIHHIWFHNQKEVANVKLPVKSSSYRTYSSKVIDASWTGTWKVKITDSDGNIITEIPFQITDS